MSILIILAVLLSSCASVPAWLQEEGYRIKCTDLALMEASAMRGHGYTVRILCGNTSTGELHATGQAILDGAWTDLRIRPGLRVWWRDGAPEIVEELAVFSIVEYAGKRRRWESDLYR